MAKIKIGGMQAVSFVAKTEEGGFTVRRSEDGDMVMEVNFPGVKAVSLNRESMKRIAERVGRERIEGNDPADVFERSAEETADGDLIARFSDAKRSRSITVPAEEREDLVALLDRHLDSWNDYEAQLTEAEKEAAKNSEDSDESEGSESDDS